MRVASGLLRSETNEKLHDLVGLSPLVHCDIDALGYCGSQNLVVFLFSGVAENVHDVFVVCCELVASVW